MSYFKIQHVLLTNEFGAKWAQLPSVLENSLAEWKIVLNEVANL